MVYDHLHVAVSIVTTSYQRPYQLGQWRGLRGHWVFQIFSDVVQCPGISIAGQLIVSVSPRFLFILVVIMIYLFVLDDSLTS